MAKKKTRKATRATARPIARRSKATTPASRKTVKSGSLSILSAGPGLTVNDVEKSIAWYRDVLGFTVGERWENDGTLLGAEMRAGKVSFMLGQDDWKKGRDRVKGEGFRLYCVTDQDVDGVAAGIKSRGGTLAREPQDEWGVRSFAVEDPDGFKITISRELKR